MPKRSAGGRSTKKNTTIKRKSKKAEAVRYAFPKGFLWGAATSAHQVEGNNIHSDWWQWEQKKNTVKNGDRSGMATDHYSKFKEDFDIAQKLSHNAHRLSIEWSRIEPEEGKWDTDAIAHYHAVFQVLKERNMSIMLTLYHFTLPQWMADKGGWEYSAAIDRFNRFVQLCATEYGEYVDYWITINEPLVFVRQAYGIGEWPPQYHNPFKAWRVARTLAKAHIAAYKTLHAQLDRTGRQVMVGIAKNQKSFSTSVKKLADFIALRIADYTWNDWFYKKTKHAHDFIGVNYYFHQRLERRGLFFMQAVSVDEKGDRPVSSMRWEIFAPGLLDVLFDLQRYNKPIFITENGLATENDAMRSQYIVSHVKEMYHAVHAGVDVRGYFHWSLLDNFEWSEGFTPRFGLVGVSYKTGRRTIHNSARVYAGIAASNGITDDILQTTPII